MTTSSLIITQYPLTTNYVDRFSEKFNSHPEQVAITNITARGYFDILRFFRNLRADVIYLPVVDEAGRSLMPLLKVLCLFTRAKKYVVIEPDFSLMEFTRWNGVFGALLMGGDILTGFFTLAGDWFWLNRLLGAERVTAGDNRLRRALYLKTNLWLGVQAGGSVAHTCGVIGGLLRGGYKVDFTSAEMPVALPDDPSLRIQPVSPPRSYVVPREMNHYRHNARFIHYVRGLQSGVYGFIYQRLSPGNFTGVVLSRSRRLPLVIEYNGSEVWLARNWGRPLTFEKLAEKTEEVCLRHAHLIVTVSDVLRDELIARGVEPERIVSYPNGVDPRIFDPGRFSENEIAELRKRYGIADQAVVATFVGTFGHWHGAEVLAKMLRRIYETDPDWLAASKLHVLFIGDGVKRPVVETILSLPGLKPYFTLTGLIAQEDTPLYMAASDVLLSPHVPNPDGSPFFGSPTKLFEYLASGRPVIASDLYQIGEIMRGCPSIDGLSGGGNEPTAEQCGILVRPEDQDELTRGLRFLIENPSWRRAAGKNARKRVLARYTWDHHVGAIISSLRNVMDREAADVAIQPRRRPIRLLFNGLHSKSGGGVTYLRNILPLLAHDEDVEVHLCVHEDQRELLPEGIEGVTVHFLNFKSGFWRLAFREQIELPRLARKIGADVTFSPANYGPLLAPNNVILLRNALSVAFVERRPAKLGYWAVVYLGTALSLFACRRAISVSNFARRSAGGGLLGLIGDRIDVVPHGVDKIFAPPADGAVRDDFLLAVSDIYVQKNLRNLLLALSILKRRHPGILLKIAGRPVDRGYYDNLLEIVEQENLEGNVEFLGEVTPAGLVDLYRQCGIFVFPSSVETFGNPLVEAMASAAPIACSKTAAMPEVVGEAALFFDPADVDDIANAIDRLVADAELRRELSRRALDRASGYSWKSTAARTLDVIKLAAGTP